MILSRYCSDGLKQITKVLIFLWMKELRNTIPLQSNPSFYEIVRCSFSYFIASLLLMFICYKVNHVRYTAGP
jgi:hypothetical protein